MEKRLTMTRSLRVEKHFWTAEGPGRNRESLSVGLGEGIGSSGSHLLAFDC